MADIKKNTDAKRKEGSGFKKFIKENYEGWLFNLPLAVGIIVFTLIPVIFSLIIMVYL